MKSIKFVKKDVVIKHVRCINTLDKPLVHFKRAVAIEKLSLKPDQIGMEIRRESLTY